MQWYLTQVCESFQGISFYWVEKTEAERDRGTRQTQEQGMACRGNTEGSGGRKWDLEQTEETRYSDNIAHVGQRAGEKCLKKKKEGALGLQDRENTTQRWKSSRESGTRRQREAVNPEGGWWHSKRRDCARWAGMLLTVQSWDAKLRRQWKDRQRERERQTCEQTLKELHIQSAD